MTNTYPAIIRGNRIEWSGDPPEHLDPERPVAVQVIVPASDLRDAQVQGARMAAALEHLATASVLLGLDDPASWERELRQDRSLPERDE